MGKKIKVIKKPSAFEGKEFITYHIEIEPFAGFTTTIKLTKINETEKRMLDLMVLPEDNKCSHLENQ